MPESLLTSLGGSQALANGVMQLSAVVLVITALVHSWLGEQRLVRPLLWQRGGILDRALVRFILRGVWHFMSILFCMIAVTLWVGTESSTKALDVLLGATALGIGGTGIVNLIVSRGRHVGAPMLVLIGVLAALALALRL